MKSIFCRVMLAVFTLNCLLPSPSVWAQTASTKPSQADMLASLQQQAEEAQRKAQEQEDNLQAALQKYDEAETMEEIYAAMEDMHTQGVAKENFERQRHGYARIGYPDGEDVLQKIKSPDFTLDQLVDMIDPYIYNQGHYLSTAYATEVFGNSIEAFDTSSLDEETKAGLLDLLPRVQLRMMHRLDYIQGKKDTPSTVNDVMARGSLRIALWKIHEFYQTIGEEDPLKEFLVSIQIKNYDEAAAELKRNTVYDIEMASKLKAMNEAWAKQARTEFIKSVREKDTYEDMKNNFFREISAYKAKKPAADSTDFQLLLLTADYATMFFLFTGKADPKSIVDMFDEGPSKRNPKFEQPYSSLFYQVIQSMYQTAKYSKDKESITIPAEEAGEHDPVFVPISRGTPSHRALSSLTNMTNPEKYSVPVRIFALEAVGKLTKKDPCNFFKSEDLKGVGVFHCNTVGLDSHTQSILAARVVDLYYPLQSTHYLSIEDYGLDSEQMKELSDQLAFIYNYFSNDELHFRQGVKSNCSNIAYDTNGNIRVLNSGTSVPRILPSNGPNMIECRDYYGKLKLITYGGLGRDSNGRWHMMHLNNGYNSKKKEDEAMALLARLAGEALLWYVGGELIGMAWRASKGTVLALGPMAKAAWTARKGRKLQAVAVQLKKSVRYQNVVHNMGKAGQTLVYTQAAKVANPGNLPVLASEAASATATTTKVVTSTRMLKNRKFFQFLRSPKAPITQIEIGAHVPGLQYTGARVAESAMPRLSKGIRNYDDWKFFTRNLVDGAGNPVKWSEFNLVSSWTPTGLTNATVRQLQNEDELLFATYKGLNQGKFNYWAHTADGWVRVDAATFGKMGQELKAVEAAVPDYYKVLGVKPTASARELKQAHRNLVKTLHPDKNPADKALIYKINEAWSVLGDAAKRTAYDAKFMAQGGAVGESVFGLSQAENGFSLAITRDLGASPKAGWGKGFDPVQAHKGLGFNAANWTENYTYQLTGHLATSGQLDILASNLLTSTQFWRGYTGNLVFFGAWRALDAATYHLGFKDWLVNRQTADHQAELNKYGDLFKPQEPADNAAADNGLELYNKVAAAVQDNSEGYFIVAPIILARRGLSNIGIGNMSFLSDKDKALYESAANRMRLNNAIVEGNEAKNKEVIRQTYEAAMTETGPEFRQFLQQQFAGLPNGNALADKWVDGYRAEMQAIYESEVDDTAKYNQMNQAIGKWTDELHGMYTQSLYAAVQENTSEEVKMQLFFQFMALPNAMAQIEKWQKDFKQEADFVYTSSKTNEEKLNALNEVMSRYYGKIDEMNKQASRIAIDSHAETYKGYVEQWAAQAAMYDPENGEKEVRKIWEEYFQKFDALMKSAKSEEDKMNEWNTLLEEYSHRSNTYLNGLIPEDQQGYGAYAGYPAADAPVLDWEEAALAEINSIELEVEQIVATWSDLLKKEAKAAAATFVQKATAVVNGEGTNEDKQVRVLALFEELNAALEAVNLKQQRNDELLPPSESDGNTQAY